MANIKNNVTELIGHTPILKLNNYNKIKQIDGNIYAKLEYLNPAGSIKDRVGLNMIIDAENKGLIKPGATLIEPTSGNTGIGIASVATSRGYKVIITLPETMSIERRNLLKAYGAELVLTEGSKGMNGAIEKANQLAKELPNAVVLGQFTNPANVEAHLNSTGPEIWNDTDGNIDILVAGVGTGGTITGVGGYLKKMNPDIKVVAVEPKDSPVLSGGNPGPHPLQGIGAGFIPEILDVDIFDEIITVDGEQAIQAAKDLGRMEGILVGISSGAALYAAEIIGKKEENKNKNIVVILPDSGDRYYSTKLFG